LPNPFREELHLEFEHNLFNEALETSLDIFDLRGNLLGTLSPETLQSQGYYAGVLTWGGQNSFGAPMNDGIYLVRIRASNGKTSAEKTVRVVKVSN
jgi:flagellar hook assembly protein FlgD